MCNIPNCLLIDTNLAALGGPTDDELDPEDMEPNDYEEDANEDSDDEEFSQVLAELRDEARLNQAINHFCDGEDAEVNHDGRIAEVINKLEDLRQEFAWEESAMKNCILQFKEDADAYMKKDSPLTKFPPSKGGSLYCDILEDAGKNCRPLLAALYSVMVPEERCTSKRDLLALSQVFTQAVGHLNPKKTSAMRKMRTVSLKNLGITNKGLDLMSKLGLCEGESSWHKIRTNLAVMDLELHKRRIAKFPITPTYDNMNFEFNKKRNDQVLIVNEYETVDTTHLSMDDGKSFEEHCEMITAEQMLLTEEPNRIHRENLEDRILTAVAQTLGTNVSGYSWLLRALPRHYQHPHSDYSRLKSKIHIEVPLNKNEMKTGDHEIILDNILEQQLDAAQAKLENDEKEEFKEDLKFCRDFDGEDDENELDEVEERIDHSLKLAGETLLWGDQGTNEKARSAFGARRGDDTILEKLASLRNKSFAGTFHVMMNFVIRSYKALIEDTEWADDKGSINHLRKLLTKKTRHITNDEDKIKTNYEDHRKFFIEIGHLYLISAFEEFLMEDENEYAEDREGAVLLLKSFMKTKGICWIWDFDSEFKYFDEAQAVAADVIVRTIILDTIELVVHEGDATGLQGCWLLLMMFFLNTSDQQRSKYAIELLLNVVQYRGLSSRSKQRHNIYFKKNMSGKQGKCVGNDRLVEWCVGYMKRNYAGQSSKLDYTQIVKMTRSLNMLFELNEMDLEAMGEDGGIGGGTAKDFLDSDESEKIAKHLKRLKLFSASRSTVLEYRGEYRLSWQGFVKSNAATFLKRNSFRYRTKTPH